MTFTFTPDAEGTGITITTDTRKRTDVVFYNRISIKMLREILGKLEDGETASL